MTEIEAPEHTNLTTDHKEKNLRKRKDRIDDVEVSFRRMVAKKSEPKPTTHGTKSSTREAKRTYTTTLDIIKGKIDKTRINKDEDCKLKRCGCGFLIKDDSEEEEDIDAEFYEVVVDEYKSYPYDLDKEFAKDLREAKKEEEAYLKAKKEREANGEAEPVHLPFWCQSW